MMFQQTNQIADSALQKKTNTLLSKDDKASNRMVIKYIKLSIQKRKPMFDQTGNVLLNGIKLSFERGFGFIQNPNINNTAHCIDDNKMVYLLGKQIIQYDMLKQQQIVISQIDQEEEITSFMYFKNLMLDDNVMYSIHAMNKTFPSIIGKNYSKKMTQKYIMHHLEKQQKIVELKLIHQNKYLVILSQLQGTFRLSYMQIQTKDILANESIYFKVNGMLIPESYPKCIILYTAGQLYMVSFGAEIKPISLGLTKYLQPSSQQIIQAIPSVFTSNDMQLYIITSKGNLLFVSINTTSNKISHYQSLSLGDYQTLDEDNNVVRKSRMPSSICCNEYNIIIGYELVEQFTLVKICPIMTTKPVTQKISFTCPNLHKILRMQFAHQTMSICVIVQVKENDRYDLTIPIQSDYLKDKGEQLGVTTLNSYNSKQNLANHQLKPGKIFPVIFNMLLHDTLVQTLRSPIQSILGWMLFIKEILDIAILPTKKIMLILSKQYKIKAIKYQHLSSTSFQRMLIWQMSFNQNDYPSSLDIHPLTFNVAIGFKQGLKLFTISSQGLKTNNIQFPLKNCQSVKYSKFGHKLIAGSSNQIIIINPYQNKIIQTIMLNSGYNIKELNFIDRDMYIFCQYLNGSSMVINCQGNKIFEVWKKQNKMICSAYDSIFDYLVVSYTQNFVKFYSHRGAQQFGILWTYPFNITQILIVNQLGTIFFGTSLGKVRAYQWPFTDMIRFNKSYTQIQLHSSSITKLKIVNDYSLLVSGAQDGTIFISKINAYSDGIAITDAEIMHSLKTTSKNYTNLFYLQNYIITSNSIQFGQQQVIVQLQSDKSDFETQYNEIIVALEQQINKKILSQQKQKQKSFKLQLQSRQANIQQLNQKKLLLKQEITKILKQKMKRQQEMQSVKLKKMRQLYQQSDMLKQQKQKQQQRCKQLIQQIKDKYLKQMLEYKKQLKQKEEGLCKQLVVVQEEFHSAIVNYKQLIEEENQQGIVYKNKMLEELDVELEDQKNYGEKLRKNYNKIKHDNVQAEEKFKSFQQMITEIDIDNVTNKERYEQLKVQQGYLSGVLVEKDKIILDEEKHVKELLSKNINNYTHQEYLKHKQEQLLEKVQFLEDQILVLDEKYNNFQNDFVQVTNQTQQLKKGIQNAQDTVKQLKQKDKLLKQRLYMKKYQGRLLVDKVQESFYNSKCDTSQFVKGLEDILIRQIYENNSSNDLSLGSSNDISINKQSSNNLLTSLSSSSQGNAEQKINKRDHLIKQVVNTNKLRKIDDNIRRTIMIKLNRQTVSLTCQVNQLRKQKKKLAIKMKQLKHYIQELGDLDLNGLNKQNKVNSNKVSKSDSKALQLDDDIVPANISIIRSKPSKHYPTSSSYRDRLLPFQLYHQNKSSKHSYHSRAMTKGDFDQSSTQLPSLYPSILKNNSISEQTSRLFNVAEIDCDEVLNNKC